MEHVTGTEFVRIRVGDYRIIYRISDQAGELDVIRIAHRSEVYKKLDRLP
jgi:mRNA-degrading endonuclease RelE of RelBE toxin-antitoxin system